MRLRAGIWAVRPAGARRRNAPIYNRSFIKPSHAHVNPIGGGLGPFMRTLTRWVAAWAGRPPCHQSGLAAHQWGEAATRGAHLSPAPRNSNPAATLAVITVRHNHASACSSTRGPDDSHVGPMVYIWAAPPTRISKG